MQEDKLGRHKMANLTLEQLAEKLNGNLWEKGNLKRVYLDRGYNTKKMSTTTFVWQDENGIFRVSCKVDCPSQGWNWIKSQEDKVKESVYEDIEQILSEEVFVIINKDGDVCDDSAEPIALNHFSVNVFYSKEKAEGFLEEYGFDGMTYKQIPKDEFFDEVDRLDELERIAKDGN